MHVAHDKNSVWCCLVLQLQAVQWVVSGVAVLSLVKINWIRSGCMDCMNPIPVGVARLLQQVMGQVLPKWHAWSSFAQNKRRGSDDCQTKGYGAGEYLTRMRPSLLMRHVAADANGGTGCESGGVVAQRLSRSDREVVPINVVSIS